MLMNKKKELDRLCPLPGEQTIEVRNEGWTANREEAKSRIRGTASS
jgi:hypothetical protein